MKGIILCEESQAVCNAFRQRGHEFYSCDLKPCSGGNPEWHLQIDAKKAALIMKWDFIFMHPPCTYTALCGNGSYHNSQLRETGAMFCKELWELCTSVCDKVGLEQPKTIMQRYIGKKTQVIHPWQFGHPETKETWIWLKGLPPLRETLNVKHILDTLPAKEKHKIWYASPSKNRGEIRSKTYPGIAEAMANQWSKL